MHEYRLANAVFQLQATLAFHLENMFQIEAMAYIPILQAAVEYMPHGFLSRTYGMSDYLQKKNNNTLKVYQCATKRVQT